MARVSVEIFKQGVVPGFSEEIVKETVAEINANDCMAKTDIYFCWAFGSTAPQSC
jgi:hypothetical protein